MADAKNVSTGKPKVGGAVFVAPLGTTLPTDATTALGSAFKDLGYCSEDGMTNANTGETTETIEWGGNVVDNPQTSFSDSFKIKLIESLNLDVLKTVFGEDNVTGALSTGITVTATSEEKLPVVLVVEMILRDGALKRIVVPEAKLTEVAEIVYKRDDAVGYDCTFKAAPYSGYNGGYHREFIIRSSSQVSEGTSGSGTGTGN